MKAMMMKVCMVLLLVAFSTATVEARFVASTLLSETMMKDDNGEANYLIKSTTTACCDKCFCGLSNPLQCHCIDVGETCNSACKACACTLSIPPQCHCLDITTFCYDKCSSSSAN